MFIIPAAGMAKAVMAVTISLQPVAHQDPASYTVRPGESLSAIAAHAYGSAADWPAVWWANRRQVANPDVLAAGQRLQLPARSQVAEWMARAALAAIPGTTPAAPESAPQAGPAAPVQAATPIPASSDGANWSAIAACESGGDWSADTGNGFYGGLQFTEETWLAYGGGQYASSANLASAAQQIAVAQRVLAGQGIGAWPVCGAGG
jgi:LysM repeat protein